MQAAVSLPVSLRPFIDTRSLVRSALVVVAASGLVALCAHISLPLPLTPVPMTLQTFAVLLLGMVLGPRSAGAAMFLYLAEGLMGMPVFSPHGLGGPAQLFGPTGGYLLSYPLAAPLASIAVRWVRKSLPAFPAGLVAGFVATLVTLTMGATWIALLLHLSRSAAWGAAVLPFLPEEIVKIIAAASFFSILHRLRRQ